MDTMTGKTTENQPARFATAGVIGGLAGGLAFGAMMGLMGMFPAIAGLVGSGSAMVGFLVHIAISLFIGLTFGLIFGSRSQIYGSAIGWGLLYGVVWWVLGPLVLMPLRLGMGLQIGAAFSGPMLMSLGGHLIYGAVTGLVFAWYVQR